MKLSGCGMFNYKINNFILLKKNVLISAHGNSLRALCKKIFNISNEKIVDFEIPTGNPLLISYAENKNLKEYKYLDRKRAKRILFNV